MSISIYWLIAGALFLAFEVFGIPGIGLMFGGIAAVVTGALVELNLIAPENTVLQIGAFFLITIVLVILFWRRLKHWRMNPSAPRYHNMVGTEARVIGTLVAGETGNVRWSDAPMRARLASPATTQQLEDGGVVVVTGVEGNILIVTPKN